MRDVTRLVLLALAWLWTAAPARAEDVDLELVTTSALTLDEGTAAGRRILERPRAQRPDAVFAANDLVALGVLRALVVDHELLVPREIAIMAPLVILTVLLGIYPSPILDVTQRSVSKLVSGYEMAVKATRQAAANPTR